MRAFYDTWYRFGRPPWVGAPRSELVDLVKSGRLRPGSAIDLGCGEGANSIFLAQSGFEVTGVDFAPAAIAKARKQAAAAGVTVKFLVDDLTAPRSIDGQFDLLVDYGTLDDLSDGGRDRYVRTVARLGKPGSQFLLWCFEWELSRSERLALRLLPIAAVAMAPGEVDRRFSDLYHVDVVARAGGLSGWPRGYAAYLLTRR